MSEATQPHDDPHGTALVPHDEPPAASACQNCRAAMQGRYCGFCGQRALRLDVSLRELLHEGLHEFLHLDARILGTLRLLLTRPGRLTSELLAGRRQRYISPVRLYLVASVLFFLTLAALIPAPQVAGNVAEDRDLKGLRQDRAFEASLSNGVARVSRDSKAFMDAVWKRAPKVAFVLVPAFALLTMVVFRRRVRFFVPHLYFALHFHSFMFLASIVLILLGHWVSQAFPLLGLLLPPVYLVAAARDTFEAGWLEAIFKSLLVLTVYGLLLATAVGTVLVLSVIYV